MSQTTTSNPKTPVQDGLNPQNVDPEVLAFRENFEARSPLDEIIREGARRMLQAAINTEVFSCRLHNFFDYLWHQLARRDVNSFHAK